MLGKIVLEKAPKKLNRFDAIYWDNCPSRVKIWFLNTIEEYCTLLPSLNSPRIQTCNIKELKQLYIQDIDTNIKYVLDYHVSKKALKIGIGNIVDYELTYDVEPCDDCYKNEGLNNSPNCCNNLKTITYVNINKHDWDIYLTPLVLANLTITNKNMSEETYKEVSKVSENWLNFLKENFKAIKKQK